MLLACELGRGGMAADKALAQARKLALVQATIWGPCLTTSQTGDHLKAALRTEPSGMSSMAVISTNWLISMAYRCPQTYAVVAEQRQLTRNVRE